MLRLHSVSFMPTFREGKSICINETNKLSMMLYFVFKEVEGKINLYFSQLHEVNFVQLFICCF